MWIQISLILATPWHTKEGWGQLSCSHAHWPDLLAPPPTQSVLVCCPGKVPCPLSRVLQLVKGKAIFSVLMPQGGPALLPIMGDKGSGEVGLFFSSITAHDRWWGRVQSSCCHALCASSPVPRPAGAALLCYTGKVIPWPWVAGMYGPGGSLTL